MDQKQTRQAVRRKPLPRASASVEPPLPAAVGGSGSGSGRVASRGTNQGTATALPPRPLVTKTGAGLDEKLGGLSLDEVHSGGEVAALACPPLPPRRQETDSTFSTFSFSTAPTWSTTRTSSTALTSPTTSGTSTPVSPGKPPMVGQFGPGYQQTAAASASSSAPAPAPASAPAAAAEPSFWKTALDETRFFAGGLVHKPYESAKHYTIVRHSPGLIMYRGPTTSVIVTVLSTADHPLPADRTVWLQRRGFSGDTGLKLKTLVGASGSWLDVTPERQAAASDVAAVDERGFQRDIAKILKKGKHGDKALAKRQPRATLVVRIPAAAADGYFRLVLCTGGGATAEAQGPTTKRKVLCGSPVFRIASTSTDASIFRGASLRTLPLEAGVKIASMIGTNAVSAVAEPVITTVQDRVAKYQPGTLQTMAATEAYGQTGMQERIGSMGESYDASRELAYGAIGGGGVVDDDDDTPPDVVGADAGPDKPFPLVFQGRVVRGTGRSSAELGVPTANLADTPDDVRLRLRGLYFGWAAVRPPKGKGRQQDDAQLAGGGGDWVEAVVAVAPAPWASAAAVVARNDVAVHLLYDFGTASFVDARLKVVLMGFLRPAAGGESSTAGDLKTTMSPFSSAAQTNRDARIVVSSLSRPRWGPQATLARMETERSERSIADKYVEKRGQLQKHVDRLPLHWAGVRSSGAEMRDQLYGNGGFWIPR